MADNELVITLTGVDNASGTLKNAMSGIKQEADKVKTSAVEVGTAFRDQFRDARKELQNFRQSLFIVTAAIGTVIATTQEASKYNKEARESFDKFTKSISSLSAMLGTALSPALDAITSIINVLRDVLEAAIAGFIKLVSLIFEGSIAIVNGMKNIADNIKNIFTGKEDPMGIIEGFRTSFARALEISNIAADQFLNKVEQTRTAVESGKTIETEKQQYLKAIEVKKKQEEDKAATESALKKKAFQDSKQLLADLAKENKAFAVINQGVAIVESIINTAQGVTKALSMANIPLAIAIGAIGAAQTAVIASQKFAEGTPYVRHLATGTDTVPAMLTPGEMVFPRSMADAIRAGDITVGGRSGSGGGGDITINLHGVTINSKENIRELAEELGFEVDRKFRNARTRV